MSKKLTEFDKRMQNYKYTSDQSLMRRTPVIIQIDGMHWKAKLLPKCGDFRP